MKVKHPAKREEQYNLFGQLITFVGGGAILAALYFHSVVPLVITVIGLFCCLSFMNGLS